MTSTAPQLLPYLERLLNGETVEWKTLGEVAELYTGLSGKNKEHFQKGNAPYVTYKNIFENLAVDSSILEMVSIGANEHQHAVQYGDVLITGSSENIEEVGMSSVVTFYPKTEIYLNSFSFGIRFHSSVQLSPEFTKYLFRSDLLRKQIMKTASGVTRFNVSKKKFSTIIIPLPPLRVQAHIVEILDKFTQLEAQLEAELQAELEARRKQYAYYRDRNLNFLQYPPLNVNIEWRTLGEMAEIGTGSSNRQDEAENGVYPFYVRSKNILRSSTYQFDETAIIIPGEGGIGDIFHYAEGKYALHQRAYRIKVNAENELFPKFLFYYMTNAFKPFILSRCVGATATSIRKPMLTDFPIPLPPLSEQRRIVDILDRFDTLTNSISEGLTKEIALRRKQYAYYRDALLSFPRPEVSA